MYDEERDEQRREWNERFHPPSPKDSDGRSAPPDCEHSRTVEIAGDGKPTILVCLDCRSEVPR